MNADFHYYATYCAAYLSGFSHEESLDICYSDAMVDMCSRTFLSKLKGPLSAATTQLQLELMDVQKDTIGLQDITRIWASFHFLPYDLYANVKGSKRYANKYRLICDTNSDLLVNTVELAKGKGLEAAGVAMHVLSDTWAHRYFAGTPSIVINNTNHHFFELIPEGDTFTRRQIKFVHSLGKDDDLDNSIFSNTIFQISENSIMSLGHGRAGHLPDYSFIRYAYLPAWGNYAEIIKDNPHDYYMAFTQMIYALRFLKGDHGSFEKERYDTEVISKYDEEIRQIFGKRQLDSSKDWMELGKRLSGKEIEPFDIEKYQAEYTSAEKEKKDDTFLGRFFLAALAQKSMVTNKIYKSGNMLAGYSIDVEKEGFKGIKDYKKLVKH